MSEYSPGPWERTDVSECSIADTWSTSTIATRTPGDCFLVYARGKGCRERNAANARLVKAAPNMLAALKEAQRSSAKLKPNGMTTALHVLIDEAIAQEEVVT